jgi:hypothetical protein
MLRAMHPVLFAAQTEAIRIEYDGPAACSDANRFFEAVRARNDRASRSEGGPGERRFEVHVTESRPGASGVLVVTEPDGSQSQRSVTADTCTDVMDALSIIAAMALEPESPNAAEPVANPVAPSPSPAKLTWWLGAGIGVDVVTPGALTFPTASVIVEAAVDGASPWSASARVALRRSLDATATSESGRAIFALTTARVEVCPLRVRLTSALAFFPCALGDAGLITAEGKDVTNAATHERPWFTAGATARLAIGAKSPRFDLEAGAVVPLYRDTFRFTPSEFVYEATGPVPFVSASVSFGLGGGS